MYTYSEIELILNNCNSFHDLGECAGAFRFLIEKGHVKSAKLYNSILELVDKAYYRLSNTEQNGNN